jgi:hypothetical protein
MKQKNKRSGRRKATATLIEDVYDLKMLKMMRSRQLRFRKLVDFLKESRKLP